MKKIKNENQQIKRDELLSVEGQPLKDGIEEKSEREECYEVTCECDEHTCECEVNSCDNRTCDCEVNSCDGSRGDSCNDVRDTHNNHNQNKNIEILQNLYRNTDMAKKAVEFLMPKTKDEDLLKMLSKHYEAYDDLANKITCSLTSRLIAPNTVTGMAVCMLKNSICIKTAFNKSNTHIADMLIKGNNMGITSLNKTYNNVREDIDRDVESLLKELLNLEQRHIDELKKFL